MLKSAEAENFSNSANALKDELKIIFQFSGRHCYMQDTR